MAMIGGGLCWLDYDERRLARPLRREPYAERERAALAVGGRAAEEPLFRNVEGRFTDVTRGAGAGLAVRGKAALRPTSTSTATPTSTSRRPNAAALLWNEGDGTFAEGAEEAGVDASAGTRARRPAT